MGGGRRRGNNTEKRALTLFDAVNAGLLGTRRDRGCICRCVLRRTGGCSVSKEKVHVDCSGHCMRLKNRRGAWGRDLRRGHVVELLVTDGLRHVDGMLQVRRCWESVGVFGAEELCSAVQSAGKQLGLPPLNYPPRPKRANVWRAVRQSTAASTRPNERVDSAVTLSSQMQPATMPCPLERGTTALQPGRGRRPAAAVRTPAQSRPGLSCSFRASTCIHPSPGAALRRYRAGRLQGHHDRLPRYCPPPTAHRHHA